MMQTKKTKKITTTDADGKVISVQIQEEITEIPDTPHDLPIPPIEDRKEDHQKKHPKD